MSLSVWSVEYYPADGVNNDITIPKLLDGTEVRHPSKSRFFQLWPWLSYIVLMSTMMVFFILWARVPSIDDIVVLFCTPANVVIEFMGIIGFNARKKPSLIMVYSPDEYGGGYMATIDAIHMLHCTDILHRANWGEHYRAAEYFIHDSPKAHSSR
ncbi:hypothetical protein EDD22DRAFT_845325 [Suillus occidentalis]|nr:hypothetical protein EDD22DRAFT_845325 [Suillus occidentalis]